ncbi:MAG: hypothetical protein WC613_01565 [Candidatus Aenigmatarchaeota archaeon]
MCQTISREEIYEGCGACGLLRGGRKTSLFCGASFHNLEELKITQYTALRKECKGPYKSGEEPHIQGIDKGSQT